MKYLYAGTTTGKLYDGLTAFMEGAGVLSTL